MDAYMEVDEHCVREKRQAKEKKRGIIRDEFRCYVIDTLVKVSTIPCSDANGNHTVC